MMECIDFPYMQWGFPALCRMDAGIVLLLTAAFFCAVLKQQHSSSSPCCGCHAPAPITEPAFSGPLPQSRQTHCVQDKLLRGSWGLPRLYN